MRPMDPQRARNEISPPSRDWFEENPHARISFTRLAVHRRCPAWYRYQYVEWNKAWTPPVTRVGHAVQETFEKVVHLDPDPGLGAPEMLAWA